MLNLTFIILQYAPTKRDFTKPQPMTRGPLTGIILKYKKRKEKKAMDRGQRTNTQSEIKLIYVY